MVGALLCQTFHYLCPVSDKRTFPRISLRVSHELKAACDKAGPERMRQALAVLLSDNAMSDNGHKVVSDKTVSDNVRQAKVKPLSDNSVSDNGMSDKEHGNVSDNGPNVSDKPMSDNAVSDNLQPVSDKPKEALTLAERIAAGRAEAERKRAAKAALMAGLPPTVRGLVS